MATKLLSRSSEFDALPYTDAKLELCSSGTLFRNSMKNRYPNILPPDHTRVPLITPDSQDDYINANYVDLNQQGTLSLIACQGPLKSTISDFWLMVLQNTVSTILMVTPLVEKGKTKCERYWPRQGEILKLDYGINVECHGSYQITDTIAVSELDLYCGLDHIEIKHFYYTGWPDFGVPDDQDVKMLLGLVMSSIDGVKSTTPIVCHCSAGVGRTGTVAAILRYYNTGEEPLEIVRKLRQQRHGMVQTKEQFRFVRGMCGSCTNKNETRC